MGKKEAGPDNYNAAITSSKLFKAPSPFFLFARNFLKHPNMVGWMLPSSPFVVDKVLRQVDWEKARVIVEYGPGIGTFTTEVLRRMRPDATLIALEINADFLQYLLASIQDPRLRLVQESAEEVD